MVVVAILYEYLSDYKSECVTKVGKRVTWSISNNLIIYTPAL